MLNFSVNIKAGSPVYEQVVYAVKKAIVVEQLKPGDKFPSVRELSKELSINPTTAQKIVAALIQEQLLEVRPGIGTTIAHYKPGNQQDQNELLQQEVEKLVVEAKRLGIERETLVAAIDRQWVTETKGE